MSHAHPTSILDRMIDPLCRCLDAESARRVIASQLDPEIQLRVDYLAERANEGLLTPEERLEYEGFVNFNAFVSMLKSKARRHLAANGSH